MTRPTAPARASANVGSVQSAETARTLRERYVSTFGTGFHMRPSLTAANAAIRDGSACIFQTVASNRASKGVTGMPPTRAHLYDPPSPLSHREAA